MGKDADDSDDDDSICPTNRLSKEGHVNVKREGENKEGAHSENIPMAAGSLTAPAPCWE